MSGEGRTLAATLSGRFWNQGEPEVWTILPALIVSKTVSDEDVPMEIWRFYVIGSGDNNRGEEKKKQSLSNQSEVLPRPNMRLDVLKTTSFIVNLS